MKKSIKLQSVVLRDGHFFNIEDDHIESIEYSPKTKMVHIIGYVNPPYTPGHDDEIMMIPKSAISIMNLKQLDHDILS